MQKCVNLVDIVKSFQTSIPLQNSASIQPRTSLSEFEGDSINFFISHRRFEAIQSTSAEDLEVGLRPRSPAVGQAHVAESGLSG